MTLFVTTRSRCQAPLAILCLLLLLTPSAWAEDRDAFNDVIRNAVTEYESGNWGEAHTLFSRAHELNPSARTWRGLGLTSFELRHYLIAIDELKAALADARKPLSSAQRREVESVLTRAEQFLATYRVHLVPPGAELRVDGRWAKLEDDLLRLDPGEHSVVARAAGYEEYRVTLRPDAGAREDLPIVLAEKAVAAPETQTRTAPETVQAAPAPAPEPKPKPESETKRWMAWTGGVTLAVGLTADIWAWRMFSARRTRGVALKDAPPDAYDEKREAWKEPRPLLLGFGSAGAALTVSGVELLLLAVPRERVPWWLAALSAGTGTGLATWGVVDIVQGKCKNADATVCIVRAQQRERGTLVLLASAPLLTIPLTKLARSASSKSDRTSVRLVTMATGASLHGQW